MKIALVVHDLHEQGGHSLYTRVLADGLSQRHEVTVFANRCERPSDARWSFWPVRAWRVNALATVRTFPIGVSLLGRQLAEFDIRHMQGFCGGQPNVVTAHICLAAYLNSLRDLSRQTKMSLRLMATAERRFYQRYEGNIIAISQKIARELQEFYHVNGPVSVISHGVDANRFGGEQRARRRVRERSEMGIDEESTVALYVGDLIKSHAHLKAIASASPEVEFMIVTSSPGYRWRSRNVHFFSASSDIARYYAAADAFIFPTAYDAFGMVVLEAMASGLAVFSSDRAGAAELIRSGKDGYVMPLDDWVEATAAALRDRDLLRALGCEAEKTARRHNWSIVVRDVEQVYLEATGSAELALGGSRVSGSEYRYQQ